MSNSELERNDEESLKLKKNDKESLELRKARVEFFGSMVGLVVSGVTLAITLAGIWKKEPPPESSSSSTVVQAPASAQVVHHVHHFPYFERMFAEVLEAQGVKSLAAGGGVDASALEPEPIPEPVTTTSAVAAAPWWKLAIAGGAFGLLLWSLGLVLRRR